MSGDLEPDLCASCRAAAAAHWSGGFFYCYCAHHRMLASRLHPGAARKLRSGISPKHAERAVKKINDLLRQICKRRGVKWADFTDAFLRLRLGAQLTEQDQETLRRWDQPLAGE